MGVSSFGDVYVAGLAFNGLTVQNAIQPEPNHLGDAFVAKIADASGSSVDNTILVSLRTGHIQEYNVAGGFTRDIVGGDDGAAKGMIFDGAGNLFVAHWMESSPATGNNVEVFDSNLNFQHTFGSGFDCNPTSVVFDAAGNLFVGESDCSGDVLKFSPSGMLLSTFHSTLPPKITARSGLISVLIIARCITDPRAHM